MARTHTDLWLPHAVGVGYKATLIVSCHPDRCLDHEAEAGRVQRFKLSLHERALDWRAIAFAVPWQTTTENLSMFLYVRAFLDVGHCVRCVRVSGPWGETSTWPKGCTDA